MVHYVPLSAAECKNNLPIRVLPNRTADKEGLSLTSGCARAHYIYHYVVDTPIIAMLAEAAFQPADKESR